MKISLITPTYNCEKTIRNCVESIINQTFKDVEYIVVDSLSLDGTLNIVSEYKNKINIKIISEKDNGIYDAMNKGIGMATGDIIGILNADDFYENENVLSLVVENFKEGIDAVYGNINYFGINKNKITRFWISGKYYEYKLNNGWTIPHPALFLKRHVYDKYGFFRLDFEIAADYEFILRILKIHKVKTRYINNIFVRMYNSGNSGANIKQRFKGWKELRRAWIINGLKIPRFFIFKRILSRGYQIIFSLCYTKFYKNYDKKSRKL